MAKKERDVTLTIQVRTAKTIRELRKVHSIRFLDEDGFVIGKIATGEDSGAGAVVQVQANEIDKG